MSGKTRQWLKPAAQFIDEEIRNSWPLSQSLHDWQQRDCGYRIILSRNTSKICRGIHVHPKDPKLTLCHNLILNPVIASCISELFAIWIRNTKREYHQHFYFIVSYWILPKRLSTYGSNQSANIPILPRKIHDFTQSRGFYRHESIANEYYKSCSLFWEAQSNIQLLSQIGNTFRLLLDIFWKPDWRVSSSLTYLMAEHFWNISVSRVCIFRCIVCLKT